MGVEVFRLKHSQIRRKTKYNKQEKTKKKNIIPKRDLMEGFVVARFACLWSGHANPDDAFVWA